VIPRRSVTETLVKKVYQAVKNSSVGDSVFKDENSTDEQKREAIFSDQEINSLLFTPVANERSLNIATDRRFIEAVDLTTESTTGSPEAEFRFQYLDALLTSLDQIVDSEARQKQVFAKKLRSFAPLIAQLRADAQAWKKIQLFNEEEAKRREQAARLPSYTKEVQAGNEYRGVLRGLIANRATRDQLELVLNDEAQRVSEKVRKERLRSGSYVPLMVFGAGVHSAIFTSEFLRTNPELASKAVVIEPRKVLGGQFRAVGGVGYNINSRTRPHDFQVEDNNLPGKTGNINSMGDSAMLQLPDVESRVYSDNEVVGLLAAMNSFLTADTALGLEVVKVRRNKNAANRENEGKYEVELRDVQTNERIVVTTDCVVSPTGLGDPFLSFDETDPSTQSVLSTRKERLLVEPNGEVPGLPSLATSAEFWEFTANNRNWQSVTALAGKDIVIVGDADSTQTILERLNGILAEATLDTATSLDVAANGSLKPITVTIIGAKQGTFEEYINGRRVRYHFVALFYPREDKSRENDTITPEKGRATRLAQVGLQNRVFYTDEKGQSQSVRADLVITGTGFRDKAKEIFSDFKDQYADKTIEYPQRDVVREALTRAGSVFNARVNGDDFTITILQTAFTTSNTTESFQSPVTFKTRSSLGLTIPARTLPAVRVLADFIEDQTTSVIFPPDTTDVFEVLRDGPRPLGRQIVANGRRENIFIAGVAGKDYEFSDAEKASYPDATQKAVEILDNTDAIWRQAPGTAYLARYSVPDVFDLIDWKKKVASQEENNPVVPERLGIPMGEKPRYFVLNLNTEQDVGELPVNSNALDILKEALSRKLAKWKLDPLVSQELKDRFGGDVTLRFLRTYQDTYVLTIDPPLFPLSVLKEVFSDLDRVEVRDLRRAVKALLGTRGSKDQIQTSRIDDDRSFQRVIKQRPSLTLKLNYNGRDYRPVEVNTKNVDLLADAPNEEMRVNFGSTVSRGPQVTSEFFNKKLVDVSLDNAIRRALTGEVGEKASPLPRASASEVAQARQSGMTPELAESLFNDGELIFEDVAALMKYRTSELSPNAARLELEKYLVPPLSQRITEAQKQELYTIIYDRRDIYPDGGPAFQAWDKVIDVIVNNIR
jgi:hypothetical protein